VCFPKKKPIYPDGKKVTESIKKSIGTVKIQYVLTIQAERVAWVVKGPSVTGGLCYRLERICCSKLEALDEVIVQ